MRLIATGRYVRLARKEWSARSTGWGRKAASRPTGKGQQCRAQSTTTSNAGSLEIDGRTYPTDEWTNVPATIISAIPRRLHLQPDHPISITRQIIESRFPAPVYKHHTTFSPVVTVAQNFDSLGFPADHPGRSRTDTYYINQTTVLRTHTSAHQADTFRANQSEGYTISADVYRRDAIDRSHYPIFHQMEGARIADEAAAIAAHLKRTLELVVAEIFSRARRAAGAAAAAPVQVRWVEASFPFTSPSWELEVRWHGAWLELLGCGVVQQDLFRNAGVPSQVGWAFGVGLERVAMLLFSIPDIRLFWSRDGRFLSQFSAAGGGVGRFVPFSRFPACYKDVSFWARGAGDSAGGVGAGGAWRVHENDVMEVVREVGGDLVEDVRLVDEFTQPRTGRKSFCYRINYRSLERTLRNEEADGLHGAIRGRLVEKLGVELR
ncbi:phenylalanyl-trna synthetase [Lasallia pustulata]|uniref:Phenylalanine--tRNA ligase, mitochondrial n=1 Tax=Lasallia pustulata TaxID=136370 RepID=A0A1W5CYH5_9LECA|nr:phenylalanyl-trna synthetase [Lasallia pustulata]